MHLSLSGIDRRLHGIADRSMCLSSLVLWGAKRSRIVAEGTPADAQLAVSGLTRSRVTKKRSTRVVTWIVDNTRGNDASQCGDGIRHG